MTRRRVVMFIVGLLVLWGAAFGITAFVVREFNREAVVETLPTPTMRPIRTDVAELRAPTLTPTDSTLPTPTPLPPTATPRPQPVFTIPPLEINLFQRQQQEALDLSQPLPTVAVQRDQDGGAYPIRLAIEDLGILSPVLVVQTDPDFNIVTPRDEVGYYALTSKIGAGGNSVMVGHVFPGRIFNKLLDAKIGQVVRITDEFYVEHYYRIDEIVRVPFEIGTEADKELGFQYIYDNSQERLTLVTCYPEYEWTHRFVVRAVPIPPPNQ